MPLPSTSKDKSARLDWGYFARSSRLVRVRRWLWLLAALFVVAPLTTATLAALVFGGPPAPVALSASRGPLSSPHAAWENQCEVCHTPFSEIHSDRWLTGHGDTEPWRNLRCEQCHTAPTHHANQKPESVAGCADCHREHQGRTVSLVRLADQACVRCHGSLADHQLAPSLDGAARHATAFARPDGHPEFRAIDPARGKYERTLKFSHATHLAKGMGVGEGTTFADRISDKAALKNYLTSIGQPNSNAVMQLDCKACHQLETDGRTYKAPNFEAHCRACHPLTFDDSQALRHVEAPHRTQPDELERFLRRVYTDRFVHEEWKPPQGPDRGTGRLDPPPAVVAAAKGKIDAAMTAARQTLLTGATTCLQCHEAEFPAPGEKDQRVASRIKPVSIPTRWMPTARFDHTAHRAMDCKQCHTQAFADKTQEEASARAWTGSPHAVYSHRPDLPDAANCRQCHAPAGGVRHGCTDCHKHHGPGHGAPEKRFLSADEWLRGVKP